ncbi:MAG: DUF885 domain-containing protein [Lachnospiraceae bacterium]|nr:DUF885 domain-containing protein [Lachnospiraceae bacterium]
MKRRHSVYIVLAMVLSLSMLLSGCFLTKAIESVTGITLPTLSVPEFTWPDWMSGGIFDSIREFLDPKDGTAEEGTQETLPDPTRDSSLPEPEVSFREFCDEIFADILGSTDALTMHYLVAHPEDYGLDPAAIGWNLGLGDVQEGDSEEYGASLHETLDLLHAYDYAALDWEEKLTYHVLEWYLETELKSVGFDFYYEPLSPNFGVQVYLPVNFAEFRLDSKEDIDLYLDLMEAAGDYFSDILAYEERKAAAGMFMSDDQLQSVIAQCRDFIAGKNDSFLLGLFAERIADIEMTDTERANYNTRNRKVVNGLYRAYEALADSLETFAGKGTGAKALCEFPNGAAYYEYLVASSTGSSRTVDDIALLLEQTCEADLRKAFGVRERYQIYDGIYPDMDAYEALEALKAHIRDSFPSIGDVAYTVEYVDASLRDYLSPAAYMTPPYDGEAVNRILVNCEPGDEPEDLFITLAHEGYPGHLYQTNYMREHCTILLRSLLETTGFAEGYAEYVELGAYDYLTDAHEQTRAFQKSLAEATLCIYGRVDIGIHYYGWDVKRITSYLSNYFEEPGAVAEEMYSYMIGDPGGYLDYILGAIEIREMETDALNAGMTLYRFHEKLLDLSGAPFEIIRKFLFE